MTFLPAARAICSTAVFFHFLSRNVPGQYWSNFQDWQTYVCRPSIWHSFSDRSRNVQCLNLTVYKITFNTLVVHYIYMHISKSKIRHVVVDALCDRPPKPYLKNQSKIHQVAVDASRDRCRPNHISKTKLHHVAVNGSVRGQVNDNLTEYGFWDMVRFGRDRLVWVRVRSTRNDAGKRLSTCGTSRAGSPPAWCCASRGSLLTVRFCGADRFVRAMSFDGERRRRSIAHAPTGRHSPCRPLRSWWISGCGRV